MAKLSMLTVGLLAASIGVTQAATTGTTFTVSATVSSACLVSATDLAFGAYDTTSTSPNDNVSAVTVACTIGTPYEVGLSAGGGASATMANRKMTSGVNVLEYSLYSNAGHTSVWGNTVGTDALVATAVLLPTAHTVYGRVPALQNVPAGIYSDTITVAVTY
jgi:spore coat protein U-like protein